MSPPVKKFSPCAAADQVTGVTFSPDGRTITASSSDRTLRIWDSTPISPESRVLRKSSALVESLFARFRATPQVLDSIRKDITIAEPVRASALKLAETFDKTLAVHDAERLVRMLFQKPMLRSDVLAGLRQDKALSEPLRRTALAIADQTPEYPDSLFEVSWRVVQRPGADPAAYRLALRQAQAASRLVPSSSNYLTALGVAQYRTGHFQQAVDALNQVDRRSAPNPDGAGPDLLAFLAHRPVPLRRNRACPILSEPPPSRAQATEVGQDRARALRSRGRPDPPGPRISA